MLAHGVSEYGKEVVNNFICTICYRKRSCDKCIPMKFFIITSKEISAISVSPTINEIINIFNMKSNDNGDELMFLFGSKILSEAYTLTEVIDIFFFTIPDTRSELMQIIARALRSFSYSDINKSVLIYLLVATTKETNIEKYIKSNYHRKEFNQTTIDISESKELERYVNELNDENNKLSYDVKKILYLEIKSERSNAIHSILKSLNSFYKDKIDPNIENTFVLELLRRYCYHNSRFLINNFINIF